MALMNSQNRVLNTVQVVAIQVMLQDRIGAVNQVALIPPAVLSLERRLPWSKTASKHEGTSTPHYPATDTGTSTLRAGRSDQFQSPFTWLCLSTRARLGLPSLLVKRGTASLDRSQDRLRGIVGRCDCQSQAFEPRDLVGFGCTTSEVVVRERMSITAGRK